MSKKLMMVTVRGNGHTWSFDFYGDPKHLADWRADGLEVEQICNVIPAWLPAWAIKPWCVLQDVFNFKNPLNG